MIAQMQLSLFGGQYLSLTHVPPHSVFQQHLTEPSDGVLSAISKRLLRVAVGAADSLYSRDLRQRSIDSYKISKTMADGLDCIYSGKRVNPKGKSLPAAVPIGKCLTEILGSNKVIKQGGLLQKVMNAAAKPLQARRDHFLAKETANKIAAGIAYIAANVKSHAEFKDEVMLLIQMEVASDEIKLAPEALDGLNLFLIVADLEGDEVSGGAFEDNLN